MHTFFESGFRLVRLSLTWKLDTKNGGLLRDHTLYHSVLRELLVSFALNTTHSSAFAIVYFDTPLLLLLRSTNHHEQY
jgi:hypothetical protein